MATAILNTTSLDFTSNGTATNAKIIASASTIDFEGVSAADCDITGVGAITTSGNASIGGTFGATGAATLSSTLDVTGAVNLNATTGSTSTTTGALIVDGGAGIAENVYIGGLVDVTGNASIGGTFAVSGSTTFSTLDVSGAVNLNDTTGSTSSTSGALIVDGGAGIAENVYIGGLVDVTGNASVGGTFGATGAATLSSTLDVTGAVNLNDTTGSTSTTSGALIVDGGAGIAENVYIGGTLNATGAATLSSTLDVTGAVNLNATTGSTSSTSGALIVDGGVGVAENVYIGGTLNATGAAALSSTLNVTGATTLNSTLTMSGQRILDVGTPTQSGDAATKAYVDSVSAGLHWKEACIVATTANIDMTTTFLAIGDSVDGVTLAAGNRVLVKNQTTASENGIYVVDSTAATSASRSVDFTTSDDVASFAIFVEKGSTSSDQGFVVTSDTGSATPGTDAINFTQFTGTGQITAGSGLDKNGNTISVNSTVVRTSGDFTMAGNIDISQTLDVTGNSTFGGTVGVSGVTSITDSTQSTSAGDGCLVLAGGLGVAKAMNVTGNVALGGTLAATGATTLSSTLGVTGATTLSSTLGVSGITSVTDATDSSSSTNGALVVTGGIGVAKKLFCGDEVSAVAFNATSDENFKQDIRDIDESDLDRLLNVRAVSYRFKGISDESKTRYGILAQDLEQNGLGHMVTTDHEGVKKVCYNDLIGLLIGEVKCLNDQVKVLKTRMI